MGKSTWKQSALCRMILAMVAIAGVAGVAAAQEPTMDSHLAVHVQTAPSEEASGKVCYLEPEQSEIRGKDV